MRFIAFDDLNRGLDPLHHAVGKGLAGVAARPGALHLAKYEYAMPQLGTPRGASATDSHL